MNPETKLFCEVRTYFILKKSVIFDTKINDIMSRNRSSKRNMKDSMIGGACSGLADYFDVDITFVRAVVASSIIFAGVGLGLDLVLWLVAPTEY